jgi:hypothetical protein
MRFFAADRAWHQLGEKVSQFFKFIHPVLHNDFHVLTASVAP